MNPLDRYAGQWVAVCRRTGEVIYSAPGLVSLCWAMRNHPAPLDTMRVPREAPCAP